MVDVKCVMVNDDVHLSGVKAFFDVYPSPPPSGKVLASPGEINSPLPEEWPTSHLKNVATIGGYPLSIEEVFRKICVNSDYSIKLNALQESRATVCGEWSPDISAGTSLEEASHEKRTRVNTWEKKMQKTAANAFLRIPDYAMVTEDQTMMIHPSLNQVLLLSSSTVAQVPYCECFRILTRIRLTSLSDNETHIETEMCMDWKQSCWLKGKIEASCEAEWQDTLKDMELVVGNILTGEAVVSTVRKRSLPIVTPPAPTDKLVDLIAASAESVRKFVSFWHIPVTMVILIGMTIRLSFLLVALINRLDKIEFALVSKYSSQ